MKDDEFIRCHKELKTYSKITETSSEERLHQTIKVTNNVQFIIFQYCSNKHKYSFYCLTVGTYNFFM